MNMKIIIVTGKHELEHESDPDNIREAVDTFARVLIQGLAHPVEVSDALQAVSEALV